MPKFTPQKSWLAYIGLAIFYFMTHLWALTLLPVFADEAIYIRWSQLILDDWQRYLFFPLNDGKTPLFIWILTPFLSVFKDPLLGGRTLGVVVGFIQVLANGWLVKALGGKPRAQWFAMVLTAILPFWYFYHRQSLIDGLLTLTLTGLMIAVVKLVSTDSVKKASIFTWPTRFQWLWILGIGLSLGAALLTKVPAILLLPALPLWVLLDEHKTWTERLRLLVMMGVGVFIGGLCFLALRLSPAFGQLFSRGSDFLYPTSEILAGKWRDTLPNIPTYLSYFMSYAHVFGLVLVVASLFAKPRRRYHLLFWSAIIFCAPIAIMGKVVYARYFMPAMIFITASLGLFLDQVISQYVDNGQRLRSQMFAAVVVVLLLANMIASSLTFMGQAVTNPDNLPLTESDTVQYVTEWSSGHGIPEVEAFIRQQAQTHTVAVATEGFFGTLPDGLFMYFAAQPDDNVYIEGIGQPVRAIPEFFTKRAASYDQRYLVVNSHRLDMDLPAESKVLEVCRPFGAPCLQVWDVTNLE